MIIPEVPATTDHSVDWLLLDLGTPPLKYRYIVVIHKLVTKGY